ncbi:MAG: hypothetical protein OEY67_05735, partial [Gammaproteobacteria bacterium]|nr:hypothetical protein [Gammaproteobacteria bacterium]
WAGGQWYARFHKPGQLQLPLLLASALVTGSAAFVISNASFYLLSGVTPRFVWTEYLYHFVKYYPPYLSGMLFYVSIVVLAYFLFGAIRRTPRHTLEADS